MNLAELFKDHIDRLRRTTSESLKEFGYDHLVIAAGVPHTYFADDHDAPFHATPHFKHWCPIDTPYHVLQYTPGEDPRLIYFAPEDFWYEQVPLGSPYWKAPFKVTEVGQKDEIWKCLGKLTGNIAYIGPEEALTGESLTMDRNPKNLTVMLDWYRSYKSDYEIACMDGAEALAAKGHVAARVAFENGDSELEIYAAFLAATGLTENQLPYGAIVCLDQTSAILHYQGKRKNRNGRVLLIDAGAKYQEFGSDITRTYCRADCPTEFRDLLKSMNALQLEICDMIRPGLSFGEAHGATHHKLGELLINHDVLRDLSADEAVELGLTRPFLPHGLGHQLGIQVHDVAGHQSDKYGKPAEPPKAFPKLRNTRILEERMMITIEPGLYFIPMLLRPWKNNEHGKHFNWPLIEKLTPFGGIRVEDDLLVTASGHQNMTRKYLPE